MSGLYERVELTSNQNILKVALQALYGFSAMLLSMVLFPTVIQPLFVPLITVGAFTQAAFLFNSPPIPPHHRR